MSEPAAAPRQPLFGLHTWRVFFFQLVTITAGVLIALSIEAISLPTLSSAAWHSAERVGALTHMEYGDVQAYAKLYGLQDMYVAQQHRLMEQTVATLSAIGGSENPHQAPQADLERFRNELLTLGGQLLMDMQLGEQLSKLYAENLQRE